MDSDPHFLSLSLISAPHFWPGWREVGFPRTQSLWLESERHLLAPEAHCFLVRLDRGALGAAGCCCCCEVASVMFDSLRPHRLQPTRLPDPWDCQGKNTGVGCHFLLQCIKVKNGSDVGQLCPILSNPVDCSPPGSSIHGIFQARVLKWGAIAFSNVLSH